MSEADGRLKLMKWHAYYTGVCVKETLVSSASAFNLLKTICIKMRNYKKNV